MIRRRLTPGLLLLAGCQPWARVPMPAPASFPANNRVEVWVGRRPLVLREVVIEADTIRGRTVPAFRRVPDSAVALPRASVDSIRLMLRDNDNWMGIGFLGGFVAGVTGMLALLRSTGGT